MEIIPQDRRVRRTKEQLKNALVGLLLEKDINSITVSEVTSIADVNRSTIYLHYRDIYDLYEKLQNEIYTELKQIFERHLKQNRRLGLHPIVAEAFDFLAKNKELCVAVLNSKDSELLSGIIQLGKPNTEEEWRSLVGNIDPGLYEYHYAYITQGCVGLLRYWLLSGMKESPADMARLAQQMIDQSYIA